MLYSLAGALLCGALFAYISLSPLVLISGFGFNSITFSLIFGAIALLNIATGALNIRLLQTAGPRALLLLGLAAHALASLVLSLVALLHADPWVFVAVLAGCIGLFGLVFGNLVVLTMAEAGPQAGVASAFMGATQYAGGALVSWLTGLIGTTATALAAVLFLCALATLTLGAVAPWIRQGRT
jgi:DHA1 family bicyclomycin/chloramphenicol resistance-like MFS transporter